MNIFKRKTAGETAEEILLCPACGGKIVKRNEEDETFVCCTHDCPLRETSFVREQWILMGHAWHMGYIGQVDYFRRELRETRAAVVKYENALVRIGHLDRKEIVAPDGDRPRFSGIPDGKGNLIIGQTLGPYAKIAAKALGYNTGPVDIYGKTFHDLLDEGAD